MNPDCIIPYDTFLELHNFIKSLRELDLQPRGQIFKFSESMLKFFQIKMIVM